MVCSLVSQHLLSTDYGSDSVLGARNMEMNELGTLSLGPLGLSGKRHVNRLSTQCALGNWRKV